MKKHFRQINCIILIFLLWRVVFELILLLTKPYLPLKKGFLGPLSWANMDGVHYLSIAQNGYFQYEQAFFPLYPLLIRYLSLILHLQVEQSGLLISHLSILLSLIVLYLIYAEKNHDLAWHFILFLIFFPTSFFFYAVYSESLFLLWVVFCMYFAKKRNWFIAGLFGALASSTRLFGVFLFAYLSIEYFFCTKKRRLLDFLSIFLVLSGLLSYMFYLHTAWADCLAFFHVQPAFGAGRSGGEFIFLGQVLWRYLKIFMTVSPLALNYWVAWLEIFTLSLGMWSLYFGFK